MNRVFRVSRLFTVWVCLALLMMPFTSVSGQPVDAAEASQRILQRATTSQSDGSHLPLLFALRQLRDPDLMPLFAHLVNSTNWQVQVHGVLGLGEINEHHRINESLIRRLAPQAQDALIATALDLDLLTVDQFDAILAWDELQPMARLVLLAELVSLNKPVNHDHLTALSDGPEDTVAALASCLLAHLGETASFTAFRTRTTAMEPKRRTDLELWTIEAIRRYRLTACLPWVREIADQSSTSSPDLAFRAVYALLELDPSAGMAAWASLLGTSPSYQQRVRFALLLLASNTTTSATTFDRLNPAADEDLLIRLIAVGKVIAAKADPTEALVNVLALNHAKSSEWAMEYVSKLPDAQSGKIYAALIDRINPDSRGDEISLAVAASSRLFRIDAEQVLSRLRAAPDDSALQQALLLGMFETEAPSVGEAAKAMRRIGSGRADSLALLLMAKHIPALEQADVEQLGKIASGGGRVSEILQVQAAWMYLKHIGQVQQSMAMWFPDSKTSNE